MDAKANCVEFYDCRFKTCCVSGLVVPTVHRDGTTLLPVALSAIFYAHWDIIRDTKHTYIKNELWILGILFFTMQYHAVPSFENLFTVSFFSWCWFAGKHSESAVPLNRHQSYTNVIVELHTWKKTCRNAKVARVSDEVLDSVRNMLFLEFFWWVFFQNRLPTISKQNRFIIFMTTKKWSVKWITENVSQVPNIFVWRTYAWEYSSDLLFVYYIAPGCW